MKKIGYFKKHGAIWVGSISVLQFEAQVRIAAAMTKHVPSSPDYVLYKTGGSLGFETEFGSAWDKYSPEQRVPYKAVILDDPSLVRPINAMLWEDRGEACWYLYWDRNATGDHMAERLFVQEELKPQIGILPISRITLNMLRFYPELVIG